MLALTRTTIGPTGQGRGMFAYTSRNMRIYWQLLMLPMVAVVGFSLLSLMQFSEVRGLRQVSVNSESQLNIMGHMRKIQKNFALTRICEKNFLISHTIADMSAQKEMLAATYLDIRTVRDEETDPELLRALDDWEQQLGEYEENFLDMSTEITKVGLTPNSGLRGTVNASIHTIEGKAAVTDLSLSRAIGIVRSAENRFLDNNTMESLAQWQKASDDFERELEQSALLPSDRLVVGMSWGLYRSAFQDLAELKLDLADDRLIVDTLSANLFDSMTAAFDSISDRQQNSVEAGYASIAEKFSVLLSLTGLVGVMVVVIAWRIGTGISKPLGDLKEAMLSLAYGNNETRIPAGDYQNEIGEMAKSVRVWRENAKERQHARNLLKKANDETQSVFLAMAEGIFETDAAGIVKLVNPAAEKMMKVAPGGLIGRSIGDIFQSDDLPLIRVNGKKAAKSDLSRIKALVGPGTPVDRDLIRDDGEKISVQLSGSELKGGRGGANDLVCVVRDMSELVQSDRKIDQLKSTLDRISGEIYMFEKDSLKFSYVNKAAQERICAETDKSVGEIPMLTPIDVTAHLQDSEFRERIKPLVDGTETIVVYESKRTHSDGQVTPQEILIQLIDGKGTPSRFIAFVNDITERKTAEADIMRMKSTLDSSSDAVFMFEPGNLQFIYLNAAAKAQTGWDDETFRAKTPADINPVFDERRFRMLTKPLVFGTQKTVTLTTDGILGQPVELMVELFETDENDSWFVVTTRDISKRKEAEREIRQLRQTLDLSQDLIYVFRPDTLKFIYLNKAARKENGWNSKQLKDMTPKDVDPKFSVRAFRETAEPLINGSEKQVSYEVTDRHGRPLEVSLQLIKPDGAEPRFVAITRDITKRKAAETAKTEFISTVSHELRTPLTSIKGALGIIQAGAAGEVNDKLSSLVSIALSNSDRLVRLINDILDLEKFEAGKMQFDLKVMDICELVDEAIIVNEAYGKPLNVTFKATGTKKPLMVNGDRDRLMQVMSNLLSNAAKFSAKGGTVTVKVKPSGGKVRVSVIDTGLGIPKAAQATIFDKFTQADSSDQRKKGGTGLGLSIVKMMVEAHKGTIDFTSIEKKGTMFFFDLDLVAGDSKSKVPFKPDRKTARSILVCEDDPDVAEVLKLTLEAEGHKADIAPTAKEALAMLKSSSYDGMTLDLNLPDLSGLALLSELRMVKALATLPVFIVSGMSPDEKSLEEGQDLGVIDWMAKPIDVRRLIQGLEQALVNSFGHTPEVLHVEDDESIRRIAREIVGECANITACDSLENAKKNLSEKQFDLVILDLDLPDGKGTDLLPMLNASSGKETPVVVFSAEEGNAKVAAEVDAVLIKSRATNEEFLRMIEWGLNADHQDKRRVAAE